MKYMLFPVVHPDEQQKGKSESGPEISAASRKMKKTKKGVGKDNPKSNYLIPDTIVVSEKLFRSISYRVDRDKVKHVG